MLLWCLQRADVGAPGAVEVSEEVDQNMSHKRKSKGIFILFLDYIYRLICADNRWTKKIDLPKFGPFAQHNRTNIEGMNPVELFELFFDEEIIRN
jgi:nucleoid DNA-binding protein